MIFKVKKSVLILLLGGFLILQLVQFGSYFGWKSNWSWWEREEKAVLIRIQDDDKQSWMNLSCLTQKEVEKLQENSCKPKVMNPFTPDVSSFFKPAPPLHCDTGTNNLFGRGSDFYFRSDVNENDQPVIIMEREIPNEFSCCYEELIFTKSYKYQVFPGPRACLKIDSKITIIPSHSQYIIVNCYDMNERGRKQIFKEAFIYVPKPEKIIERNEKLNVIILGFDQVSRLNFIRLMRKTFHYLKNSLEVVDLQGFNKVGSATLNNTLAFMTGNDFGDVRKNPELWKDEEPFFDKCRFLWKDYKEKGYVTVYGDDYNSVFDYRYKGFRKQPTDYYLHPFIHWYHDRENWRKFGKSYDCFGREPALKLLFNFAKSVSRTLHDRPYFSFLWNSRISEMAGYPSLYDSITLETLKYFEESGELNKSLVLLMSDHGWRTGPIMMSSKQARLENMMSFAFILLPKWFRRKYKMAYENLKDNQYRLTTPYDIHATLLHLLDLKDLRDEVLSNVKGQGKGMSLFLPILKERTCHQAGIDETWCACTNYKEIPATSSEAIHIAKFAVQTLNSWLKPFKVCQKYELHQVASVELMTSKSDTEPLGNDKRLFRVRFVAVAQVTKRKAHFETTVITQKGYWNGRDPGKITMSTEVFRLNVYGNSADCMTTEYSLRKFCTCY